MNKLKKYCLEIEDIVEKNIGKELTDEVATNIYGYTNDLLVTIKKLRDIHVELGKIKESSNFDEDSEVCYLAEDVIEKLERLLSDKF